MKTIGVLFSVLFIAAIVLNVAVYVLENMRAKERKNIKRLF